MRKINLYYSFILCVIFSGLTACDNGCRERIKKDCAYLAVYDPVCGCNGKTYSNSGEAECSGITRYYEGVCKE